MSRQTNAPVPNRGPTRGPWRRASLLAVAKQKGRWGHTLALSGLRPREPTSGAEGRPRTSRRDTWAIALRPQAARSSARLVPVVAPQGSPAAQGRPRPGSTRAPRPRATLLPAPLHLGDESRPPRLPYGLLPGDVPTLGATGPCRRRPLSEAQGSPGFSTPAGPRGLRVSGLCKLTGGSLVG